MSEPRDGIGRRTFLGGGAVAASALGATADAEARRSDARTAEPKKTDFILDSHIHCGGDVAWVDEMVAVYRRHDAMACVLTWIEDMELMVDAIAAHHGVAAEQVTVGCGSGEILRICSR